MATLKVNDLQNNEKGTVDLADAIVEKQLNPFVIKDVVVAQLAARRQGTHKTKERSEVSGSRKKLFRQKGTGNARVGYPQSPVRRGGGTVFGPVPRDHAVKVNKKVRKAALAAVLGEKIKNQQLIVVEDLKLESHKTKDLVVLLKGLDIEKALFVYKEQERTFELASRNLTSVDSIQATGLSVYDVLCNQYLVVTKDALLDIEGRLLR